MPLPSGPAATPAMHRFFDKLFDKARARGYHPDASPPHRTLAAERTNIHGKHSNATFDDYKEAELFCARHPVEPPKHLPSDMVERLSQEGCKPWRMRPPSSPRFRGYVESGIDRGMTKVVTDEECMCVCLFSDLPIVAGLYDIKGKRGVYYEVVIGKMDGIIAIGNTPSA